MTVFDPNAIWKRKKITNYRIEKLLVQVFDKGNLVYTCPNIEELRSFCKEQLDTLWEESKRFEFPHKYYVDLSQQLWDKKQELLVEIGDSFSN